MSSRHYVEFKLLKNNTPTKGSYKRFSAVLDDENYGNLGKTFKEYIKKKFKLSKKFIPCENFKQGDPKYSLKSSKIILTAYMGSYS